MNAHKSEMLFWVQICIGSKKEAFMIQLNYIKKENKFFCWLEFLSVIYTAVLYVYLDRRNDFKMHFGKRQEGSSLKY